MARTAKTRKLRLEEEHCIWIDKHGRYAWEVLRQYEDGSQFRKGGACKALAAACVKRDAAVALFESGAQPARYSVRSWADHCVAVLWKDDVDNGLIKDDTLTGHRSILENHILPMMGDLWLEAVTLDHCKQLNQRLVALGRDEDTRANIRNTGSKLYSTAILHRVASSNPFKGLIINRRKAKRSEETGHKIEGKRILTVAEEAELLSWAENHWAYGMVLIGLKMGLRKGEITGMTWHNVDWQGRQYYVEEQVRRSRTTCKLVVEDLKTTAAERHIPLHDSVWAFLNGEHTRPDRHPVKVFANTNGNWISPEDSDEAIEDLRMIAGLSNRRDERGTPLPDPGWHDLRHTFATRLANAERPVGLRTLMELMGHANVQMVQDYYVSSSTADKRSAISLL